MVIPCMSLSDLFAGIGTFLAGDLIFLAVRLPTDYGFALFNKSGTKIMFYPLWICATAYVGCIKEL